MRQLKAERREAQFVQRRSHFWQMHFNTGIVRGPVWTSLTVTCCGWPSFSGLFTLVRALELLISQNSHCTNWKKKKEKKKITVFTVAGENQHFKGCHQFSASLNRELPLKLGLPAPHDLKGKIPTTNFTIRKWNTQVQIPVAILFHVTGKEKSLEAKVQTQEVLSSNYKMKASWISVTLMS